MQNKKPFVGEYGYFLELHNSSMNVYDGNIHRLKYIWAPGVLKVYLLPSMNPPTVILRRVCLPVKMVLETMKGLLIVLIERNKRNWMIMQLFSLPYQGH